MDVCEVLKQVHQFAPTGIVEKGRRFVEQQEGRLLGDGTRYHGLLFFAIAERAEQSVGNIFDAHQTDGLVGHRIILVMQSPPNACVSQSPVSHHFAYIGVEQIGNSGQDNADAVGSFDGSGEGMLKAGDGAKQCALSRTVAPQQAAEASIR